jgi:hypothetical protein
VTPTAAGFGFGVGCVRRSIASAVPREGSAIDQEQFPRGGGEADGAIRRARAI